MCERESVCVCLCVCVRVARFTSVHPARYCVIMCVCLTLVRVNCMSMLSCCVTTQRLYNDNMLIICVSNTIDQTPWKYIFVTWKMLMCLSVENYKPNSSGDKLCVIITCKKTDTGPQFSRAMM